jgi:hypothetical protein
MLIRTLCLVKLGPLDAIHQDHTIWDQENWIDDHEEKLPTYNVEYLIPLIDHLHNDIENGQKEAHYHVDDRFQQVIDKLLDNNFDVESRIYLDKYKDWKLEYRELKRDHNFVISATSVQLIKNSKLKHKCIHKGKCPHRGFDLSNETPDHLGNITCPLHGLIFNKNKQLINTL